MMATDRDRNQCEMLRIAQVSTSIYLATSCDERCDRGSRYFKDNSRVVAIEERSKTIWWAAGNERQNNCRSKMNSNVHRYSGKAAPGNKVCPEEDWSTISQAQDDLI